MKRLSHRKRDYAFQTEWPQDDNTRPVPLFKSRIPLRKMVVMIDADVIDQTRPRDNVRDRATQKLLKTLLEHKFIEVYRFSDSGVPKAVKPLESELAARYGLAYPGWAVLEDDNMDTMHWEVVTTGAENIARSTVQGQSPRDAHDDIESTTYQDLKDEDAARQRFRDVLAYSVADQALQADLFITKRPYLYNDTKVKKSFKDVAIMKPNEALPLVSLYLRSQRVFKIDEVFSLDKGLFYWVGTRELLPSAWRWFTACVQHSTKSGDDKLMNLGGSLLQRVNRALIARDEIHVAMNQPQDNNIADDALSRLDEVLYLLMGAMDVSARVAHCVIGLTSNIRYAGWQNDRWIRDFTATQPKLAALTIAGTNGRHVVDVLRFIRNSIHGEALQGISISDSGFRGRTDTMIKLPSVDLSNVLTAIDGLGGRMEWGITDFAPGEAMLSPSIFVDKLFQEVIELLNQLMDETPVETLPYVMLKPADLRPPENDDKGFSSFAKPVRESVRQQLGFQDSQDVKLM